MENISKIDIVAISLLALLSLIGIIDQSGAVPTINNYAAYLLLALTIYFQIFKSGRFRWGVLLMLLLDTLGIINFSHVVVNSQIKPFAIYIGNFSFEIENLYYSTIGVNFFFFIALLVYCYVNIDYIKSILGSSEQETNKMIEFYYRKFSELPPEEYQDVKDIFDKYPEEAQIAINRIESEKLSLEGNS